MSKPVQIDQIDNSHIRKKWHEGEWYYCISDFMTVFLGTGRKRARNYYHVLKGRLKADGSELVTKIRQLKLVASDGKRYKTDVANEQTCNELAEIVQRMSFNTRKRFAQREDEVGHLHPLVVDILEDNGWTVSQHVSLPSGKIADIIAQRERQTLLVECKRKLQGGQVFRAIGQILCYADELNGSPHLVLACPKGRASRYAYERCESLGIAILEIAEDTWQFKSYDYTIVQYHSLRRSESCIDARTQSNITREAFAEALRIAVFNAPPSIYMQATDKLYRGLWERTTAQLRGELEISKKANPRDYFGKYALVYTRLAEDLATEKLDRAKTVTMTIAMDIVWAVAKMIGRQAREFSEELGYDLVTEKPLLEDRTSDNG